MALLRGDLLRTITDGLGWVKNTCELQGVLKLFDSHVVSQHFFCRLLNCVYRLRLEKMDQIQANYPAIDLGDSANRIAYQITTERGGDKVQHTLDMFLKHGLEKMFDTLKILVIGERQQTYKSVDVQPGISFDCERDIVGIKEFLKYIETLNTPHLEELQAVIVEELKLPTRPGRKMQRLPAPLSENDFVGRAGEQERIKLILKTAANGKAPRLELWGMGGGGKTTLAVFVANQLRESFPDLQGFFDLQGTTEPISPTQIMKEVIEACLHGIKNLPDDPEALGRLYLDALADKKALIVLDDARDFNQVEKLLPPVGCGLIVSSRNALHLAGSEVVIVDQMTEDESFQLLRTLVSSGSDDEMKTIAGLCGFLPLALNIAGAFLKRIRIWSAAEYIAALMKDGVKRLKLGDDPKKNVERVLALSAIQLVSEDEVTAAHWQELAVIPGQFEESVSAAVMNLESNQGQVKDILTHLYEHSLIQFDDNNCYYRLHDLVREIAIKVFDWVKDHPLQTGSEERREAASKRYLSYGSGLFQRVLEHLDSHHDHDTQKKLMASVKPELTNMIGVLKAAMVSLQSAKISEGVFDMGRIDPSAAGLGINALLFAQKALDHLLLTPDMNETLKAQLQSPVFVNAYLIFAKYNSQFFSDYSAAIKYTGLALAIFEDNQDP
jgi:hypothetical protein